MNELKIECNDPLKEVKLLFAEIKEKHSVNVTARINSYFLGNFHLKNPEMKNVVMRNLHQQLGLKIQEGNLAKLIEYKDDDLLLIISAAVMDLDQVYNYIVEAYDKGLKTGFENGQIFSKHLNRKDPSMVVMNEPKTCQEKSCGMKFYYLKNLKTGKHIPIDIESLNAEEIKKIEHFDAVIYDSTRHVSHFKTCKNPNRFSKGKK